MAEGTGGHSPPYDLPAEQVRSGDLTLTGAMGNHRGLPLQEVQGGVLPGSGVSPHFELPGIPL
jgi:hypothetical protein